ncbi:class A beta-lactamase [Azospirillum soli]|uniref:class A beta-lactamase n=1 Tax=Azospirillum soli TaxID=1304799 RepID=UPI001AE58105|nr:class A beta-lactamase [Azospirillum soli]MBP2312178.1 beta-lactamase class A [Azospirillum soli]
MQSMLTRRGFSAMIGTLLAGGVMVRPGFSLAANGAVDEMIAQIAKAEKRLGARMGVAILDTETGRRWNHRADERFPMCSTVKLLACGAVLARVDEGQENLGRRIRFQAGDIVSHSPVTKNRVGGDGMTLAELCEATMTLSDNTAANLILHSLGGPSQVTGFARSLGDSMTRLDRWETELNEATPGDPRDTTTPAAMAGSLRSLILGDRLSQRSRDQLTAWMVSNKTGDAKLRAGLPKDWRVGDKTGGGNHGTTNDVAVIWPTNRKPVFISVYMTETKASFDDRNAGIADIGRALRGVLAA